MAQRSEVEAAHPAEYSNGRRDRAGWLLACVGLAALTHIDALFGPLHSDASAWLYIAQQRDRGLVPYRDLWENKPPAIFLLYRAAWKSGSVREFIYVYDVVLTGAAAWMLFRLSAAFLCRDAALLSAALLILATAHPALHYGAGITEASALPWVIIGLSMAVAFRTHGGVWRAVACGLAWSWAIAFRMPAIVSLASVVPWLLSRRPNPIGGSRVGLLAGAAIGGLIGGVLVLLDPIRGGYWRDFFEVVVTWNLKYAAHDVPSISVSWDSAIPLFFTNLSYWIGLHAMAIAGFVMSGVRWKQIASGCRLFLFAGFIWYIADLLSTFPTLHQYPHHHYMTLGSVALNAAVLVEHLRAGSRVWLTRAGAAIALAYSGTVVSAELLPKLSEPRTMQSVLDAADYLRTATRPDDPVLLWVWHEEAELLWRVDRPPPARHFMPAAAFVYDPGIAMATCEAMLLAPPRFIADSRPYLALVENPPPGPITPYQQIQRRYFMRYRPVAKFGRITIYERRDEAR